MLLAYFRLRLRERNLVQPGNFFLSLSLSPPFPFFFAVSHTGRFSVVLRSRNRRTKKTGGKDRGQRILRCSHETRLHVRTANFELGCERTLGRGHRFPFPLLFSSLPFRYLLMRACSSTRSRSPGILSRNQFTRRDLRRDRRCVILIRARQHTHAINLGALDQSLGARTQRTHVRGNVRTVRSRKLRTIDNPS